MIPGTLGGGSLQQRSPAAGTSELGSPLLGGDAQGHGEGEGHSKNNLSTLNGCYIPCLLNILGAVLFLRIGFSVGQLGLLGTLGVFGFSEGIAYLTITSFSAIVTNGRMKGGGAYYMISRNLGPAFGGSSGLLFWFTYCINVTFNCVAFTETFMPTFFPQYTGHWYEVMCSTITLFMLFLIAYGGAGLFAKVNTVIFVLLGISLSVGIPSNYFAAPHDGLVLPTNVYLDAAGSSCVQQCSSASQCSDWESVGKYFAHLDPNNATDRSDSWGSGGTAHHAEQPVRCIEGCCAYSGHFYPWAWESDCPPPALPGCKYGVKTILYPAPAKSNQCNNKVCSLSDVFAIIFPAVCGMMEGANLSGDLKDPAWSIPYGTLAAVSTALLFYVCLIIGQAGSMDLPALHYNMRIMQDACLGTHNSWGNYFVVLGVATACLSTSLGSMFGSARILQAISRDNCVPAGKGVNSFFALGTVKGDEPRRAVCLTYLIAQSAIFIGGLDKVAPILTNFFLLTYSLTNLATFLLETSGLVNFRPVFRFYCWHTALIGALLNMVVMFYCNVGYAAITVMIVGTAFVWLALYGPATPWGDISQAILFQHARASVLRLQGQALQTNTRKFWRPSILLLSQTLLPEPMLLGFLDDAKKGGVLVLGHGIAAHADGSDDDALECAIASRKALLTAIVSSGVKAFPQVIVSPSLRLTCQNLILSAGLPGALEPDLLALELPPNVTPEDRAAFGPEHRTEYIAMLRDTLALRKPVLMTAHFGKAGAREPTSPSPRSREGVVEAAHRKQFVHRPWSFGASRMRGFYSDYVRSEGRKNAWEEAFASPALRTAPDVSIDVWLLPGCEATPASYARVEEDQDELAERPMLSLVLQLAYILSYSRYRKYKRTAARVNVTRVVLDYSAEKEDGGAEWMLARVENERALLTRALLEARISGVLHAEAHVALVDGSVTSGPQQPMRQRIRQAIRESFSNRGCRCAALLVAVPPAPTRGGEAHNVGGSGAAQEQAVSDEQANEQADIQDARRMAEELRQPDYLGALQDLAYGGPALPPTVLVSSGCTDAVITTQI